LWLHSLKVAQLLRSAACLHTNQSRSYLNHLVYKKIVPFHFMADSLRQTYLLKRIHEVVVVVVVVIVVVVAAAAAVAVAVVAI